MEVRITVLSTITTLALLLTSCEEKQEHTAPAIYARDSVAMMTTYGVNTLISDSGTIKYRIVAERWEINQNKRPSRWIFDKGVFLEQFDDFIRVFGKDHRVKGRDLHVCASCFLFNINDVIHGP